MKVYRHPEATTRGGSQGKNILAAFPPSPNSYLGRGRGRSHWLNPVRNQRAQEPSIWAHIAPATWSGRGGKSGEGSGRAHKGSKLGSSALFCNIFLLFPTLQKSALSCHPRASRNGSTPKLGEGCPQANAVYRYGWVKRCHEQQPSKVKRVARDGK